MLDIKKIKQDPAFIKKAMDVRGTPIFIDGLVQIINTVAEVRAELETTQAQMNTIQSQIDLSVQAKEKPSKELTSERKWLKEKEKELNSAFNIINEKLQTMMLKIPNIPALTTPYGKTEADNVVVFVSDNLRQFNFQPKEHTDLNSGLDFEAGVKLSGPRFSVMRGKIALLHRALINFCLNTHVVENGYEEVNVPYIVNEKSLIGTGQLPKFEEDLFKLNNGMYLIPTAEVPVTNLLRDCIVTDDTEYKFVAHTPCFRSEAGSYGKDTKGLIRQHQFEKVELVQIVKPENSDLLFEQMVYNVEKLLIALDLPYRKVLLCTGDLGFSAAITYDFEVFLPGQGKYREISSCSNCHDFQARRLNAKFKKDGKNEYFHTHNGSGLAIGRTLVAIIENYQEADGRIKIPDVLQPYVGFEYI